MTERRPRVVHVWVVLAIVVPASLSMIGALIWTTWKAATWYAADIYQAEALVDFRKETKSDLAKIVIDVADIRLAICAMNAVKCRIKSASEDSEDTRRASAK